MYVADPIIILLSATRNIYAP